MQSPLQITFRDIQTSLTLEQRIREKASKLDAIYSRIIACHVMVERVQRHQRQGQLFNVHIRLTVPGGEIAVNRNEDEEIYVALRETFDAARRRLEGYVRKQIDKDHGDHAPRTPESGEST
jgi:ribosome-associated translation inhibitor RaiA